MKKLTTLKEYQLAMERINHKRSMFRTPEKCSSNKEWAKLEAQYLELIKNGKGFCDLQGIDSAVLWKLVQ